MYAQMFVYFQDHGTVFHIKEKLSLTNLAGDGLISRLRAFHIEDMHGKRQALNTCYPNIDMEAIYEEHLPRRGERGKLSRRVN